MTGGTGFVGSHLVAQLVEAGHDVVALVRSPEQAATLPDAVETSRGDVTDRASLRDGMAGVEGVFHLAGWFRVGDPDVATAERVNVDGTRNVLELVDELGVPKVVHTSSLAVNSDTGGAVVDESYRYGGPHLSVYDRTKWQAHYEVAEPMADAGVPVVTALPGVVYGPGDRGPTHVLWRAYLAGDLPAIPSRGGVCFGHVEDTARALRLAMDRGEPGEEYIVAGAPFTYVETFELAERLTGIDAPRAVPPAVFRGLSIVMAGVEAVVTPPRRFRSEALRALAGVTYWGDNAKATRELGLEHRPFESGLEATLADERRRLAS